MFCHVDVVCLSSCVHPVAVLDAAFCMTFLFLLPIHLFCYLVIYNNKDRLIMLYLFTVFCIAVIDL